MFLRVLGISALTVSLLSASELEVYGDRAYYTYKPDNAFIGFASQVSARNAVQSFPVENTSQCPDTAPLCTLFKTIHSLQSESRELATQHRVITTMLDHADTSDGAQKSLEDARIIAQKLNAIETRQEAISQELSQLQSRQKTMTEYTQPIAFTLTPTTQTTLEIPYGITFQSAYELDADTKGLRHMALLKNRSGINLSVDTAKLFVHNATRIAPPMEFYPLKIYPYSERSKAMMQHSNDKLLEAVPAPLAPQVIKERHNSYRISKLSLPSDGIWHRSLITTRPVALKEHLIWHAYASPHLYKSLNFTLESPLEANTLTLFYEGRRLENVPFQMNNSTISLNAAIDYDVSLERNPLREFSATKGFFQNDRVKQEGYELHLTNHAKEEKKITIIERIPLSTQEEIEVTLEHVQGVEHYTYNKENGRLEIPITLAAKQTQKISFDYSIRYPNKMQIHY
jgi:hypothetical protein